jgi:hypothetical protein
MAHQARDGAGAGCKKKLRARSIGDAGLGSQGGGQQLSEDVQKRELALAPVEESGERSFGV